MQICNVYLCTYYTFFKYCCQFTTTNINFIFFSISIFECLPLLICIKINQMSATYSSYARPNVYPKRYINLFIVILGISIWWKSIKHFAKYEYYTSIICLIGKVITHVQKRRVMIKSDNNTNTVRNFFSPGIDRSWMPLQLQRLP